MAYLEQLVRKGSFSLLLAVGCVGEQSYDSAATDATTGAWNPVVISPAYPTSRDTLTCLVEGVNDPFDFYWFVNTEGVYEQTGEWSVLSSRYTSSGDDISCSVWTPASAWYDGFEYGSATVSVQ